MDDLKYYSRKFRKFRNIGIGLFGTALLCVGSSFVFEKPLPEVPENYGTVCDVRDRLDGVRNISNGLKDLTGSLLKDEPVGYIRDSIIKLDEVEKDLSKKIKVLDPNNSAEKYEQDFWKTNNQNRILRYALLFSGCVSGFGGLLSTSVAAGYRSHMKKSTV